MTSSPGRGVYIKNDRVVFGWYTFPFASLPSVRSSLPFVPYFSFSRPGPPFDHGRFLRKSWWTTGRIPSRTFSRSPTSIPFRAPGRVIYFDSICKPRPLETALSVIPKGVGARFGLPLNLVHLSTFKYHQNHSGSPCDETRRRSRSTVCATFLVCGRFCLRLTDTSRPRFNRCSSRNSRGGSRCCGRVLRGGGG